MKIIWKNRIIETSAKILASMYAAMFLFSWALEMYFFSRDDYRIAALSAGRNFPYEIKGRIYYLMKWQWDILTYTFRGWEIFLAIIFALVILNEYFLKTSHDSQT